MLKMRLIALAVLVIGAGIGWAVSSSQLNEWRPFKLGLDLSGGTQLVYRADLSAIPETDVQNSMASLRDTVERRVNLFGVGEPIVQTDRGGAFAGKTEERLIVELPGITDTDQAIAMLGETPVLEFRLLKEGAAVPTEHSTTSVSDSFEAATVTGQHLDRADLQFGGNSGISNEPIVVLNFNSEGGQLFGDLTTENVGRIFGIFLDGVPISTPVINEPIPGGSAIISGNFAPEEARELVRNLNFGALPVPIELLTTETVGGTLGTEAVERGIIAGIWGIISVMIFMLVWYRLPGLISAIALSLFVIAMLGIFQLIPVTLTAAGIAAFILSVGMAVDANILIFERTKEELREGKETTEAISSGFARAWLSIRDSNISSMITAVILFSFGTSIVKGFALVFGLGVLVSMLTAISVSRTFLLALGVSSERGIMRFLLGSGVKL